MKKIRFLIIIAIICCVLLSVAVACNNNDGSNSEQSSGDVTNSGENNSDKDSALKDIEGIEFKDLKVTYDGNAHSITINGEVPKGVKVEYVNSQHTDSGSYDAKAILSGEGYKTLTLSAKLVIDKANFQGITFPSVKESYDGLEHMVEVVGQLPENTTVSYVCKEDNSLKNKFVDTGKYTVIAQIKNPNYFDLKLETTIEITASEKERYICYAGGKLYFANALDDDSLYYYNAQDGVTKISSDVPYNFAITSDGNVYFRSYTLLASSIKKLSNNNTENINFSKGEYLCTDGANLYFAKNGLTDKSSGIYRITINKDSQTVSEPELLSQGKAKYLQIYGDYIYFADGNNGYKLSKLSINGGQRTLLIDEKIAALTVDNGYLFFTVDKFSGRYIANYNIYNKQMRKLTMDAGSNLTVIGDELYYLNVDLLTSTIRGSGIYKVDAYPANDKNLSGTKVIGESGENYTSLAKVDGNSIAYYKVSTQMLCLYNLDNKTTKEILDGFTVPETTPISMGSKLATYGDYVYFMDIYKGKSLYSYNVKTKMFNRITSGKVIDFAILGDILYFNIESYGIKNYLYKLDMKGGIPELIVKNDCVDIITDGESVFYVEKNNANVRTAIHRIDSSGVDTIMYDKGAQFLSYYDNFIYFVDGKDLLKMPTKNYTVNQPITVKEGNVDVFTICDGVVYFREQYGIGWLNKRLSRINVDGTGYAVIVSQATDPLKIIVDGDHLYYYNDVTSNASSGIYRISTKAREDETPKLILGRNADNNLYCAEEMVLLNNKLYFVNYYNMLGDSHFYSVEIESGEISKLA